MTPAKVEDLKPGDAFRIKGYRKVRTVASIAPEGERFNIVCTTGEHWLIHKGVTLATLAGEHWLIHKGVTLATLADPVED